MNAGAEAADGRVHRLHVMALHGHAEAEAARWRRRAALPAALSMVALALAALAPWLGARDRPPDTAGLAVEVLKVSVLLVVAVIALFAARMVWNTATVWLGRAGTLEDLALALKLIGKPMDYPGDLRVPGTNAFQPFGSQDALSREDGERLLLVVQCLERLRRSFEGELLKGPPQPDVAVSLKPV